MCSEVAALAEVVCFRESFEFQGSVLGWIAGVIQIQS